jgi:hypothetical protein
MIFVSLLPLWTGLYLALSLGADWHVVRLGYCPLRLVAASVLAAGVSFVVDVACAARDPSFRRF